MWLGILSALAAETTVTPEVLSEHAEAKDCWLAIEGGVYDVSDFVASHPGGRSLTDHCGTDATEVFRLRPGGTEHSLAARQMLANYRIGRFEGPVAEPQVPWRTLDPMWARKGVMLQNASVIGHQQLHFEFAHYFGFRSTGVRNLRVELGWGLGNRADLVLSHSTWSGESGGQLKIALAQQDGRRRTRSLERGPGAPLSAALVVTGGYRVAEAIEDENRPVFTTQLVMERAFGPARLALVPGVRLAGGVTPFGGVVLDVKPHHTGGFFAEAIVTRLGFRTSIRFSAGLRMYTRAHVFSLYSGTSAGLAPGEAASPVGGSGIGFSMARRFPLPVR